LLNPIKVLLLIDNFDSFSHILADSIRQTGAELKIVRNNTPLALLMEEEYNGIILSPGPGIPKDAGNMMEVLDYYHDKLPVLGICLGHQAIGEYFGAKLVKSRKPVHGKISQVIKVKTHPLLQSFPKTFNVTRYHSLELQELPSDLEVILSTQYGEIMAVAHTHLPICGVQYHPEAYLTEMGLELLSNWVRHVVRSKEGMLK
jgi:anthranilate synthase component 2